MMSSELSRCPWSAKSPLEIQYHDTEWGVPVTTETGQFEFLTLEAAQAGLSWNTILAKRNGYRECFAGFCPEKVAAFGPEQKNALLTNPAIVRNRLKIEAAVHNARCFLEVAARHGTFCAYIWAFVDGVPVCNAWKRMEDVPATTALSERIAKELKRLGFKFLGPTTVYAHMQATGMVNDHLVSCFRYKALAEPRPVACM